MQQNYVLTIRGLFSMSKGDQYGAETQVAILDNGVEVDRVHFRRKCQQYLFTMSLLELWRCNATLVE